MPKNADMPKFTAVSSTYDPLVDVAEVDQFGYTDLRQAFLTGTIEGTSTLDIEEYNGVDAPDSLLPAAKDIFESYRQANMIRSHTIKSAAAGADAPAEAGAASSAAAE